MKAGRAAHLAAALVPFAVLFLLGGLGAEAWLRLQRFGIVSLTSPTRYMPPQFRITDCFAGGTVEAPFSADCRMRYKGADIVTNSLGLNDREVDESRPHFRAAVLGDSVSMAAGVPPRDVWHAVLEDRISHELGSEDFVEFYNLSRGGRTTVDQVAGLEHALAIWPLDAAVIGVVPSDFLENVLDPGTCRPGDNRFHLTSEEMDFYSRKIHGHNPISSALYYAEHYTGLWLFQRLGEMSRSAWRSWNASSEDVQSLEAFDAKAHEMFRSCAIRMREIADAAGIDLLWAMVWYEPQTHGLAILEILESLGEPAVSMIDVHEGFPHREDLFIYPGDNHPNAGVQRIFADRLHAFLDGTGWLERIRRTHRQRTGSSS